MTDGYRGAGRRGAGLRALAFVLCFALTACTTTLSAGRRDVVDKTPDDNFDGFLESESLLPVPKGPPTRPLPQSPGRHLEQAATVEQSRRTGQLQPADPPTRTTGSSINGTLPARPTDDFKENQELLPTSHTHDAPLKFTPDDVLTRGPTGPQGPPSRYSAEINLEKAGYSQSFRNSQDQQNSDTTGDTDEELAVFSPFQEDTAESAGDDSLGDLLDAEKFLSADHVDRVRRQADNTEYQSGDNCDTSTCPSNEYCATLPQGKFCVCSPGFKRPLGTTGDCSDVDECALNEHNCVAPQTCQNTVGSYSCVCPNSGVVGTLSTCVGLYPYGSSQGDAALAAYDDSTTSVSLDGGFPVGESRYDTVHIGTNGIISFGYPYNSPIPYVYDNYNYYNNYYSYSYNYYNNYYMSSGFYNNYYYNYHFGNFYKYYYFYPWNYYNRPRIIAPFWTDISLRGGRGNIYYRVYRAGCATDTATNYVLLRANSDMATYKSRRNFKSRMVMVVTWNDVEPYSDANYYSDQSWWYWWNGRYSQYYSPQRERITFQSVLISDGRESFVLFYYKQGNFSWRYKFGRRIVIGSVGINDQFSTVYHSYSSSAFIMDQLVGNTGERGFWAFQVGNHYSSAQACLDWYNCNKNDRAISSLARFLPDCPCAPQRLAWDRRWSRPFFRNSHTCFTLRPQFWLYPLGKECCYRNGFFETRRPYAGRVFRYHPWYDWRRHQTMDVQAKDNCCSRSSLCHLYYELRPTGRCSFVSFWQEAALFGDPHILTLDSKSYTFNGWGEYDMLLVDTGNETFVLQGRTSQAMTESGATSNATVFTAFAARDSQNATMHVELNLNKTGMVIYGNGIDQTNSFYADELFEYESDNLVLSRENQSLVVAFAASGASLKITVGVNLLTVTVTAPTSWRNSTRGLMGNFNGDPEDDFVARNGSALPGSATEEEIFTHFGNTWEITQADSVLMYPPGKSHSDYQNPNFQPIFLDQVDQATLNRSYEVCGGRENLACVYDFVATGSVNIATASATTLNQTMAAQTELKKVFPSLEAVNEVLQVNVNETVKVQLNGSDPDTGNVTYHAADNVAGVTLDSQTGMLTYNPTSLEQQTLGFYVVDSDGLKSPVVVVDVVLCSGCSGHGTCNYTDTSRTDLNNANNSNTRLAVCTCQTGWTGADCERDLDACAGNPCAQGQNCIDLDPATHKAQLDATPGASSEEVGFNCSACPEGFEVLLGKCLDIDECNKTNPCQQRCENTEGSYRCACEQGFRMVNGTCTDIDECLERIADCQQVCTNTPGSFNCSCEDGYQVQPDGKTCKLTDAARCAALQCDHGCRNSSGTLGCFCFQGYRLNGSKCENVDECSLTPRPCAQQCEDLTPGFRCSCFPGHILSPADGSTCLPCGDNQYGVNCSQTCECGDQSQTCHPVQGCLCSAQWTGANCTEDVNECEVNPNICNSTDQICVNTPGSYECQCLTGYALNGTVCTNVDECSDVELNNCSSNQLCRDTEGSYVCECNAGFAGPNCDDIDECLSLQSGCSQLCDNMRGSFNCRCYQGYVLADDRKKCIPDAGVDPCAARQATGAVNCSQGCIVDSASNTSRCLCGPGFRLGTDNATCTDINECTEANPCSHNCSNSVGGFTCSCRTGFALDKDGRTCRECDNAHWGVNCSNECRCGVGGLSCDKALGCQCKVGFNNTGGKPCEDVNECTEGTATCGTNATCDNTPGSYRCLCAPGFTLNATTQACEDIDECLSSPCDQSCINTVGSFLCNCNSGFTVNGTRCQDINECEVNNGGCQHECRNNLGSFACDCRAGYQVNPDKRLECIDIDECQDSTHNCSALETCNNNVGGFTCPCKAGYTRNAQDLCSDIDECQDSTHNCSALETCNNNAGGFTCPCKAGYTRNTQGHCTDVDECQDSTHNCSALETCNNNVGGFTCPCKAGYARNTQGLCTDIDECQDSTHNCSALETCNNNAGGFTCPCKAGYTRNTQGQCTDTNSYSLQLSLDLPYNTPNLRQRINDLIKQHYEKSFGVVGAVEAINPLDISPSTSGNGTMVNLTLHVNRNTVPQTDAAVAKATAGARTQGLQGDSETVPVTSLQLQGQEVAATATSCQVFEQLSPCTSSTSCDASTGLPACKPLVQAQTDNLPLIIGLAVGLSLALLALVAACGIFAWCRSRRRRRAERAALGRGNIYGSVRQAFGSSIPTRHHGKSKLLYEPDTLSSASSAHVGPGRGKSAARPDFQDSPWFEPEQPARPEAGNQPSSNFSWDFLYRALQPDGEFKIERPQFTTQANQIFKGRGQFPDSTA